MGHQNIGVHQFNVGDEVAVTGYDEIWNGSRFIVEAIKPHEEGSGVLLKMSPNTARMLWEKVGHRDWWQAAEDDEGFDNIWWWEGFITQLSAVHIDLENE